jgi:hypothetical protein
MDGSLIAIVATADSEADVDALSQRIESELASRRARIRGAG